MQKKQYLCTRKKNEKVNKDELKDVLCGTRQVKYGHTPLCQLADFLQKGGDAEVVLLKTFWTASYSSYVWKI